MSKGGDGGVVCPDGKLLKNLVIEPAGGNRVAHLSSSLEEILMSHHLPSRSTGFAEMDGDYFLVCLREHKI